MNTSLKKLRQYCAKNKLRLTEPRQYVYEIIAQSDKPIGAYDVLTELSKKMDNPKPPTAYRALEFLSQNGLIHRIESLNAYVACHSDHNHSGSQFMICDSCGDVFETHLCALPDDFRKKTQKSGFAPQSWNIEIHGQCARCH